VHHSLFLFLIFKGSESVFCHCTMTAPPSRTDLLTKVTRPIFRTTCSGVTGDEESEGHRDKGTVLPNTGLAP
jgi:hypothetical protein